MINIGDVYYSSQTNRFFQVRKILDDYIFCGGMTRYYDDAKTDITIQHLSYKFLSNCKKVTAIDTMPEVEFDTSVCAWKVKENNLQNY